MDRLLKPQRFDAEPNTPSARALWIHWHKTFTNFLNSITEKQVDRLSLLVNFISPKIYLHIIDATDYEAAIQILNEIYVKPQSEILARHQLSTRRQNQNETINNYIQSLRLLSKECNFTMVTAEKHSEERIRDTFIAGLHDANIRQRLLENKVISLDTAISQALALEMAQENAGVYLQTQPVNTPIASIKSDQHVSENSDTVNTTTAAIKWSKKCYFCGYDYHIRTNCPAREATCKKCFKTGHFGKVCRSTPKTKPESTTSTIQLCEINNRKPLNDLQKSSITLKAEGNAYKALLDSGSSLSFIDTNIANRLNLIIHPTNTAISMASTSIHKTIRGYCYTDFIIGDHTYDNFKLNIMDNLCSDFLLGHDFMQLHEYFQIHFKGNLPPLVCSLKPMNIESPKLFENLAPFEKPIAIPSRKFTYPDQKFIKEETQRLLKEGIIEPSSSPWRSQVLVTTNSRHKKRMVIDYSRTINRYTYLDAFPLPNINDTVQKIAKNKVFSKIDLQSAYYQIPIRDDEKQYTAFEADGKLFQFLRLPFGLTNAVAVFQRIMSQLITDNNLKETYSYLDDIVICGSCQMEHDSNLKAFNDVVKRFGLTLNKEKCDYNKTEINFLGFNIKDGNLKPDPDRLKPLIDLPLPDSPNALKRTIGLFSYYSTWITHFSDKIHPLTSNTTFPLNNDATNAFNALKQDILNGSITFVDPRKPFTVETDASDFALAATLMQEGKPVAFFSKTISPSERHLPAIEKEAAAIVESIRKWRHYLLGQHFTLITDQRSISFMFDQQSKTKIKNDKILRWRIDLSGYSYDIKYRAGKKNHVADTLSRTQCASMSSLIPLFETHSRNDSINYPANTLCASSSTNILPLESIHQSLCHPGVTRLLHYVKSKNLPYSTEDVKRICNSCKDCATLKPRFYTPPPSHLIKATQPFERLSMDFVGPKESSTQNKYILVFVDEFSRFPFAFPTRDMTESTVKICLNMLFSLFGYPSSIHSDKGAQFMSNEITQYLTTLGIAKTNTTPYNPAGNGQCERTNGTLWKTIQLALKTKNLPLKQWESVLPDALNSMRSLLCTATNCTPHERFFKFNRKTNNGKSLPSWLLEKGKVLFKRHVRVKGDPIGDEVVLLDINPHYATVQHANGRQSTVSVKDLSRLPPEIKTITPSIPNETNDAIIDFDDKEENREFLNDPNQNSNEKEDNREFQNYSDENDSTPRKSTRVKFEPDRFIFNRY